MIKNLYVYFIALLCSLSVSAQSPDNQLDKLSRFLSTVIEQSDPILANQSQVELPQHSATEIFATVQSQGFSQNPGSKVTIKTLIGSSTKEATEHYDHMFESFDLEGFYLRTIRFADADRASESNIFDDGTSAVTWQKGAVVVEVRSVHGCKTLALRVHRQLEALGLYKSVYAKPSKVVAVISGMVTSLDGEIATLEFETHVTAEPKRGDQVEFSKLEQGKTVKSGVGQVVESGLGFAIVNITEGTPELMHRGNVSATGKRGFVRGGVVRGGVVRGGGVRGDYPADPLDVAKAFLQLLFEGDTDRIGKYINPRERAEAVEFLLSHSDAEYRGHRLEQYTFGEIKIDGNYASIMARGPDMPEMDSIGKLIRVDGKWYATFGMDEFPIAQTKQVQDKDGQWVNHIPESWVEEYIESEDLTIFRPPNVDEYQVHIWIRKLEDDQAAGTPDEFRALFPTSERFAVQFEDEPHYSKLAGYTNVIYAHLTGKNLLHDLDIPESDERWHMLLYQVNTYDAVYLCAAICLDDYYAEYQQTLSEIFSELDFR